MTFGASGFLKSGPTAHAPRQREIINAKPFLLGYGIWGFQEKYGVAKFAEAISQAKGSGVITPDLTVEESDTWRAESNKNHLNRIFVVAPSTTNDRLAKVASECSGFIYAASLMGVTGTRNSVSTGAADLVIAKQASDAAWTEWNTAVGVAAEVP